MALALLSLLSESADAGFWPVGLLASCFEVQACASLGDLWSAAKRVPSSVALVDWQRIGGLLSEEHRHDLSLIDRVVPLVLVLDGGVAGHMSAADLGVTAVVDRPMGDGELLALVTQARLRQPLTPPPLARARTSRPLG